MSNATLPQSSPKQCFYTLLGVEKTATQDQIRKAYLKASLRYHPDKNPGDTTAEEMFKEIAKAYAILSDEDKRKIYDEHGHEGLEANISAEELFEQMFGTKDPVEAFKKIMKDPEMRGPVILGAGLLTSVAGAATIYNGIKNKKSAGAVAGSILGGLAGTVGGLAVGAGGLVTWGVDAGIGATKKYGKVLNKKIKTEVDDFHQNGGLNNIFNKKSDKKLTPSKSSTPETKPNQSNFTNSQNPYSTYPNLPKPSEEMPKNQQNLPHPFGDMK